MFVKGWRVFYLFLMSYLFYLNLDQIFPKLSLAQMSKQESGSEQESGCSNRISALYLTLRMYLSK